MICLDSAIFYILHTLASDSKHLVLQDSTLRELVIQKFGLMLCEKLMVLIHQSNWERYLNQMIKFYPLTEKAMVEALNDS